MKPLIDEINENKQRFKSVEFSQQHCLEEIEELKEENRRDPFEYIST